MSERKPRRAVIPLDAARTAAPSALQAVAQGMQAKPLARTHTLSHTRAPTHSSTLSLTHTVTHTPASAHSPSTRVPPLVQPHPEVMTTSFTRPPSRASLSGSMTARASRYIDEIQQGGAQAGSFPQVYMHLGSAQGRPDSATGGGGERGTHADALARTAAYRSTQRDRELLAASQRFDESFSNTSALAPVPSASPIRASHVTTIGSPARPRLGVDDGVPDHMRVWTRAHAHARVPSGASVRDPPHELPFDGSGGTGAPVASRSPARQGLLEGIASPRAPPDLRSPARRNPNDNHDDDEEHVGFGNNVNIAAASPRAGGLRGSTSRAAASVQPVDEVTTAAAQVAAMIGRLGLDASIGSPDFASVPRPTASIQRQASPLRTYSPVNSGAAHERAPAPAGSTDPDESVVDWLQNLPPWLLQQLLRQVQAGTGSFGNSYGYSSTLAAAQRGYSNDASASFMQPDHGASIGSATAEWLEWHRTHGREPHLVSGSMEGWTAMQQMDQPDAFADMSGSFFALTDNEQLRLLHDIAMGAVTTSNAWTHRLAAPTASMRQSSRALATEVLRQARRSLRESFDARASQSIALRPQLLETSVNELSGQIQFQPRESTPLRETHAATVASQVGAATRGTATARSSAAAPLRSPPTIHHEDGAQALIHATLVPAEGAVTTQTSSPLPRGSLAMRSPLTAESHIAAIPRVKGDTSGDSSFIHDTPAMRLEYNDSLMRDTDAVDHAGSAVMPVMGEGRPHISTLTTEMAGQTAQFDSSLRTLTPLVDDVLLDAGDPRELNATLLSANLITSAEFSPRLDATLNDTAVLAESLDKFGDTFCDIPELPVGTRLRLAILSTWGDTAYVGLHGVEIFLDDGTALPIAGMLQAGAAVLKAEYDDGGPVPAADEVRDLRNVFDGVNFTCDDAHAWLAPWVPGRHVVISLELPNAARVAMIRVFNYNKSRIHSYRGARLVQLTLDDRPVFRGEVRKAAGRIGASAAALQDASETVLFTMDSNILSKIHEHDPYRSLLPGAGWRAAGADYIAAACIEDAMQALEAARPQTAENGKIVPTRHEVGAGQKVLLRRRARAVRDAEYLPYAQVVAESEESEDEARVDGDASAGATAAAISGTQDGGRSDTGGATQSIDRSFGSILDTDGTGLGGERADVPAEPEMRAIPPVAQELSGPLQLLADLRSSIDQRQQARAAKPLPVEEVDVSMPHEVGARIHMHMVPIGRVITIRILSTHGDPYYAGLSGLSVRVLRPAEAGMGAVHEHPLHPDDLFADPPDINIQGHTGDPRTLDKLLDGVNVTNDDTHMWLIPYTPTEDDVVARSGFNKDQHILEIDLGEECAVAGISFWNYNKSPEDTFRGVRCICIEIDGVTVVREDSGSSRDVHVLRRAPGDATWDFGQHLDFLVRKSAALPAHLEYYVPNRNGTSDVVAAPSRRLAAYRPLFDTSACAPSGMTWKFLFPRAVSDRYYLGLDALALYDASGRRIPVLARQIHALPAAVSAEDARQARNLAWTPPRQLVQSKEVDEAIRRGDDPELYVNAAQPSLAPFPPARSWLTTLPARDSETGFQPPVMLIFAFDVPVSVAFIRLFNYTKAPSRGVGAVEIFVDGFCVFAGDVAERTQPRRSAPQTRSHLQPRPCTSIVFGADAHIVMHERSHGGIGDDAGASQQSVACYNNRTLQRDVSTLPASGSAAASRSKAGAQPAGRSTVVVAGGADGATRHALSQIQVRPMTSLME